MCLKRQEEVPWIQTAKPTPPCALAAATGQAPSKLSWRHGWLARFPHKKVSIPDFHECAGKMEMAKLFLQEEHVVEEKAGKTLGLKGVFVWGCSYTWTLILWNLDRFQSVFHLSECTRPFSAPSEELLQYRWAVDFVWNTLEIQLWNTRGDCGLHLGNQWNTCPWMRAVSALL